MFEFHTPDTIKEQNLEKEVEELKREVRRLNGANRLIEQINPIIQKAVTSDALYKNLTIYVSELVEILTRNTELDIVAVKQYIEHLVPGSEVDVFIGMELYDRLYNSFHKEEHYEPKGEGVDQLYDIRTCDEFNLEALLGQVKNTSGFTQISDVKMKPAELSKYTAVGVWTMEELLGLAPGFVVFLDKERTFYSPIEKELITIFMQFIQPIIANKITISLLAKETELARKASMTDTLTGLNNRGKFNEDYLNCPHNKSNVIMYLDLNKLKSINDTYGHDIADGVLKGLGNWIRDFALELGGDAYRIGGDEFVARIPGELSDKEIEQKLEEALIKYQSIEFDDGKEGHICTNVSIGVARNTNLSLTQDEIVKVADKLMYKSKLESFKIEYSWSEDNKEVANGITHN